MARPGVPGCLYGRESHWSRRPMRHSFVRALRVGLWALAACGIGTGRDDATLAAQSVADPTRLPRATGQRPVAGTYGRSLAAGHTYVDPNSGVTVLKLTDASTPENNAGM